MFFMQFTLPEAYFLAPKRPVLWLKFYLLTVTDTLMSIYHKETFGWTCFFGKKQIPVRNNAWQLTWDT